MKLFDDFEIGEKIITRGRTITETDIVNFCMFSGDWYPIHSDKEYAAKSPFGERIAHGMLVLSATSGLVPFMDWAIIAFYGMDKVRFISPTKIGDTLHLELEVLDKNSRDDQGGVVTFQNSVKNQRSEDVIVSIVKVFIAKQIQQAT